MPGKRWISEEQRRKITADYLGLGNYRAAARLNRVAPNTVKHIVMENAANPSGEKDNPPDPIRAGILPADEAGIETAASRDAGLPTSGGRETERCGREGEEGFAEEEAEEDEIRRLKRLLLRRMGDPEAVLELNAYQAARVYAMLSDKAAGKEEETCVRVSFGSVNGEDLGRLAR